MGRKVIEVLGSRLRARGFRVVVRGDGTISLPKRGAKMFNRRQMEKIYELADWYGARVRVGQVIVSRQKGKRLWH